MRYHLEWYLIKKLDVANRSVIDFNFTLPFYRTARLQHYYKSSISNVTNIRRQLNSTGMKIDHGIIQSEPYEI